MSVLRAHTHAATHDAALPPIGDAPSGTDMVGNTLRAWIAKRDVSVDQEDHICVTLAFPNDAPLWVTALHATLSTGSHHLIVDRALAAGGTQPQSCGPTMGGDNSRLLIAQQPDTSLSLPAGTAFRIEAHQAIFLQLHYINYTGKTADIEGVLELRTVSGTQQPAPTEVHSLFTGNMALFLAQGQSTTAEHFFTPAGTAQKPLKVFALTSHTHSLGVDSTIERVANAAAATSTPLHQSVNWSEPPLTTFDPPLDFTGSDGLRLRCKYTNTTDHVVTFGTRAEDEMCFMWLYYYQP